VTIRSPQALRQLLDRIMAGLNWADAMAGCGARSESAGWTWKHKSKEAQAAGDESSVFFLDWPVGSEKQWFHILCDVARDRRGALLATLKRTGDTCEIVDGRIAYQKDDFGGLVLDDLGVPVVERVAIVEAPLTGKHRPNPDAVYEAQHPPRKLAPSSLGHKPREVPVPAYVGSALGDYLKENAPKSRPMTELERELREKLAAGPANPRPNAPVHIIRDQPDDAKQERINRPSDQTGLPQTDEVSREPAPRPAYVRPPRLDGARVPPPGGFKVG
jgi:hypothetical protein